MKKDNNYILPTIGPETEDNLSLGKILKYSNVLRLNGSHNTLTWHKETIKKIKKIDPNCTILFDIPGVKPRTLNKSNISIKKNETINFIDITYKGKKKDSILLSNLIPKITKTTDIFSIADGQYSFKLIKSGKGFVNGKSGTQLIWEWLEENKLDHLISKVTSEKPRAVAYIDDKAIKFSDWNDVLKSVSELS